MLEVHALVVVSAILFGAFPLPLAADMVVAFTSPCVPLFPSFFSPSAQAAAVEMAIGELPAVGAVRALASLARFGAALAAAHVSTRRTRQRTPR